MKKLLDFFKKKKVDEDFLNQPSIDTILENEPLSYGSSSHDITKKIDTSILTINNIANGLHFYRQFLLEIEKHNQEKRTFIFNTLVSFFETYPIKDVQEFKIFLAHTEGFFSIMQFDYNQLVDKNIFTDFLIFFEKMILVLSSRFDFIDFKEQIEKHLSQVIKSTNFKDSLVPLILNTQNILKRINSQHCLTILNIEILLNLKLFDFINQTLNKNNYKIVLNNQTNYFVLFNKEITRLNKLEFIKNKDILKKLFLFFKNNSTKEPNYFDLQSLISLTSTEDSFEVFTWYKEEFNLELIQMKKSSFFYPDASSVDLQSFYNFTLYNKRKKSSWSPMSLLISEDLIDNIESMTSIKELISKYTNIYNKRLGNFIRENIDNPHIFSEMQLLNDLQLEADTLCNTLNKQCLLNESEMTALSSRTTMAPLLNFYPINRILILFNDFKITKQPAFYLSHTIEMLSIVQAFNQANPNEKIEELVRKPKDIKELHDFLSKLTLSLKQKNYALTSQEKFFKLEEIKHESLKFKIPKQSHDLIDIGQSLKICVGSGRYAERILNNELNILTVFNNKDLVYCIHINPSLKIIEARSAYNREVPPSDLDWIKNSLENFN